MCSKLSSYWAAQSSALGLLQGARAAISLLGVREYLLLYPVKNPDSSPNGSP